MEISIYVAIALEMIILNLFVIHRVSKHRFSTAYTFIVLGILSVGFLILMNLHLVSKSPHGYHSGAFLLLGLFYLIPYKYVYNQSLKFSFAITCTSWLHTLFLYSLSVRIAFILNQEWFEWTILVAHTLLCLVTVASFVFTLNKAIYALRKLQNATLIKFIFLGILWFATLILLNILFEEYGSSKLELLVTLLLLLCTMLSYRVFYSLIDVSNTAMELTKRTRTDALTGLKNREAFLSDAQKRIESNTSYTVIFMDLDRFKQVNDRYGHEAGDQYLVHFANIMRENYHDQGTAYRLSGDEFVFLYLGSDVELFCSQLESRIISAYKGIIRFQGLSLGYASYPQDGKDLKQLLHIADHHMYQNKKVKHMIRP